MVFIHNSSSQNPWNFLSDKSHGSIFCYNIGLLSSVPENASQFQSHKCERDVLLFITSPSHHNWIYINKDAFAKHLRLAGCQGHQLWIEGWNFQSQTLISREGRGAKFDSITNGQWVNQPRLYNEASTKVQKEGVQGASTLENQNTSTCHHARTQVPQGQKFLRLGLRPMYLFIWLLIHIL